LRIKRLIFGSEEHSSIADTLYNIGNVYDVLGQCDLSLNNYNESLRIKRLLFGSDEHSSIADTLNNIGLIYKDLGKYDLALNNFNESLRIYRLIFGTDEHLSIADTLNNIAILPEPSKSINHIIKNELKIMVIQVYSILLKILFLNYLTIFKFEIFIKIVKLIIFQYNFRIQAILKKTFP
jgi:tetratricopeptide (TPR) repeat protein